MKILVMGGTRFVGKSLVEKLLLENHEIDIFTRGIRPVSSKVNLIKGDRNQIDNIKNLKGKDYDFVFDISGREVIQTKNLLENINNNFKRYVYVSSAGVYKDCDELPLLENNVVDPESRHKGKFETENWLIENSIPFTSFRPTYIYGPNNYNKLENWFFERIIHQKKIPVPGDGNLITQLGHVSDLTDAMLECIKNKKAKNNIYNCSGEKSVTIKGLIFNCAKVCNVNINNLELIPFDYKKLDPKARKAFPIRLSHYQTSISKIKSDLNWTPKFDLINGLKDSFNNDYKFKINDYKEEFTDKSLFNS
tara:strand:+ start:81 stop:1001 length:921 start_codon:yes stop_codon:yes gene_type:complete